MSVGMAMRTPSAAELLALWEWASGRGVIERGLVLLAAACPDASIDALLCLPIGKRASVSRPGASSWNGRRTWAASTVCRVT